ncbi:manno-octulosonate cytidylyltransferase [Jannaschia sp. LMIT008]|uniref:3-deoxy-manno-octulosonate cytidylyltransferase n=1 Tax=Jannaschia maritima TaxID=3032585 RepID=UPI002812781A|nr:manno-octulosonate cytidylyltransferase [Jannaschia sp. LMIT008]
MKTAIVIPARFQSSRYPGKPLVPLRQADGSTKSLIRMTWEAAVAIERVDAVHVATDDDRIADHARGFGASVLMTSPEARNGTERCAEASAGIDADLIVNLQGDAPLTPPWFVTDLIDRMARGGADMATPVLRCDGRTYAMLREDRQAGRVGGTTAVFDDLNRALYFSKEVIPYIDPARVPEADIPVFHHVGCYAYTPEALRAYVDWPESDLERVEGLEQLRFVEHGVHVACVEVDARGRTFWELNNPEDVSRIEAVLVEEGS